MSETKEKLKVVMEEIEEKTTQKIINSDLISDVLKFGTEPSVPHHLKAEIIRKGQIKVLNIIKDAGDEFKEKMGRNMTYSEMRAMMG
jgi:hypothetical protein